MGYLNDGARTAEAITPDGFLRSGDLGYVDGEGYLHITGRRKEILITAGGENVAPVRLHPARVGAPVLIAADASDCCRTRIAGRAQLKTSSKRSYPL